VGWTGAGGTFLAAVVVGLDSPFLYSCMFAHTVCMWLFRLVPEAFVIFSYVVDCVAAWQINSAVFMKVNSASINMLRLAGSYVTYGPPNLKTVRELVYKRGFASVNKQRIPITDNKVISDVLGEKGLTCMEDVIHEIFTVGKNFKAANRFFWP